MWKLPSGAMCAATMCAKDRDMHRDMHIAALGTTHFPSLRYIHSLFAIFYRSLFFRVNFIILSLFPIYPP